MSMIIIEACVKPVNNPNIISRAGEGRGKLTNTSAIIYFYWNQHPAWPNDRSRYTSGCRSPRVLSTGKKDGRTDGRRGRTVYIGVFRCVKTMRVLRLSLTRLYNGQLLLLARKVKEAMIISVDVIVYLKKKKQFMTLPVEFSTRLLSLQRQ